MNIVIFTHPDFFTSASMPKYAKMLELGMKEKGHTVQTWTASPLFHKLPVPGGFKKWMGYIDQFLVFPFTVKKRLKTAQPNTIYVFSDQALGPWVPLVAKKPHVIHCHDFLALRSSLGELQENKVRKTGRYYQSYIKKGFQKGNYFISISKKTQEDLHRFLEKNPKLSKVVYNGLNQPFKPADRAKAKIDLKKRIQKNIEQGFILHVGGNHFYKNRVGVVKIYLAWREFAQQPLPLIMVGSHPTANLEALAENSQFRQDIYFISGLEDEYLQVAYQAASVLLFPSLEEGFGWPIAEAMASGCPVITTKRAPMTEVGENSCYYIERYHKNEDKNNQWAKKSAKVLEKVLHLSTEEREKVVAAGKRNAKRFSAEKSLQHIESIYKEILEMQD